MNSSLLGRVQIASRAWARLASREQRVVVLAGSVVLLVLVWMLGIAPALKTLRTAPAQHEMLDAQLQSMNKLAVQARGLQNRPAVTRADAVRALQSSLQQRLGASAQLNIAGDRVTVVLKGAAPDMLAQWLVQARVAARAVATQSRLTRGAAGWDGTVVFNLPAASP